MSQTKETTAEAIQMWHFGDILIIYTHLYNIYSKVISEPWASSPQQSQTGQLLEINI